MWCLPDDDTKPVITPYEQIHSAHRGCHLCLPQTAIVFFMSKGTDHLAANYASRELPELFPCFLNRRPIWEMLYLPICFLNGGSGAPQAQRPSSRARQRAVSRFIGKALLAYRGSDKIRC